MKLIKAIKLQRKLRMRQEFLCYKVCQWSQVYFKLTARGLCSPHLNEFAAANKAVRNINKKIPEAYFVLSDILVFFGILKPLRYDPTKASSYNPSDSSLIAFDLISNPGLKTK